MPKSVANDGGKMKIKIKKKRRNTNMEMCYSGALVMPSSYAVMDEEEMMYVEGGSKKWVKEIVTFLKEYLFTKVLDWVSDVIWKNRAKIWQHFLDGLKPNDRTKATPYYKTFSNELAKML